MSFAFPVSSGLLALATLAAPAAAQVRFVAVPGDREFTGRMIVRPRSLAEWTATGSTPAQARLEISRARDLLEAYEVIAHVPQTDEYLLAVPAGRNEEAVATELLATGRFRYVEPDWLVYPV